MLYFGPETILPLASAAAAIGGAVLMFWRRTIAILRRVLRSVRAGAARVLGLIGLGRSRGAGTDRG